LIISETSLCASFALSNYFFCSIVGSSPQKRKDFLEIDLYVQYYVGWRKALDDQRSFGGNGGLPGLVWDGIADLHNRTVAFRVGGWVVTTYSFFAGAAFFSGCTVFLWFSLMAGADPVRIARLVLVVGMPAILIGLRLFTILTEWKSLFARPWETVIRPGYMLHGGIGGGILACVWIARVTGIDFFLYSDGAALALPLAEAIGRIGCHVYGCCWGRPTGGQVGIRYTSKEASAIRNEPHLTGVKLHPVQIYSAMFALILFVVMLQLLPWRRFDGMLTAFYCTTHPIGRVVFEQLRQDNRGRLWGRMTHTNLYSVLLFAWGTLIWIWRLTLPNTRLNLNAHWSQIVTNPKVMESVVPFTIVFFFAYGVHYKIVGSWLRQASSS
jgi:phosphatidylglycerol:prolipoprotein diacylglycerol transferase